MEVHAQNCTGNTISGNRACACQICPDGTEANDEHTECELCDPGEFSSGGSTCQSCTIGEYSTISVQQSVNLAVVEEPLIQPYLS